LKKRRERERERERDMAGVKSFPRTLHLTPGLVNSPVPIEDSIDFIDETAIIIILIGRAHWRISTASPILVIHSTGNP